MWNASYSRAWFKMLGRSQQSSALEILYLHSEPRNRKTIVFWAGERAMEKSFFMPLWWCVLLPFADEYRDRFKCTKKNRFVVLKILVCSTLIRVDKMRDFRVSGNLQKIVGFLSQIITVVATGAKSQVLNCRFISECPAHVTWALTLRSVIIIIIRW